MIDSSLLLKQFGLQGVSFSKQINGRIVEGEFASISQGLNVALQYAHSLIDQTKELNLQTFVGNGGFGAAGLQHPTVDDGSLILIIIPFVSTVDIAELAHVGSRQNQPPGLRDRLHLSRQ